MARRLSQLWFGLLAVLLTGRVVATRWIRIDDSTRTKTVLLSCGTPKRTNYSLVFSPGARILQTLLNIDPGTGVITLTRCLKCGHSYNRTCVVAVRSVSVGVPAVLFSSPVVVLLSNRPCVERRTKFLSDTRLTTARLIHSSLGTSIVNENDRIVLERRRPNGFQSSSRESPRRFYRKTSSKTAKDFARTLRYFFGVRSGVMHSSRFRKNFGTNGDAFDEARLRIRRSTSRNNPPTFAKQSDLVSVQEDVEVGTTVYTVFASDPDRNLNGKVSYEMTASGNIKSDDFFKINASTGQIRTVKQLDREDMSKHDFTVTAKDGGIPPLRTMMRLTVKVLDINDHSPVFDQKVYSTNISEAVDIGSTVLAVRAHDLDIGVNKKIRYSIVNSMEIGNVFSIGHDSGIISVEEELDREQVAFYKLVVKAEDKGTPAQNSTAEVFITLLDENDCFPEFNESEYKFLVRENSKTGLFVGATNATDCDIGLNKKVKYSITSGNQDGAFRIEPSSGIIRVQGFLDFEKKQVYMLQVTAEDFGEIPEDNTVWVQIDISDVNDCLPKFLKNEYRFKVREDVDLHHDVGMVEAEDQDTGKSGQITFLLKDGNVPFEIQANSGNSGKLRTKMKLDREKVPTYELKITAQDKGSPPLNTTVAVFITVEDVNDNPPYFTTRKYNATIPEDFSPLQEFLTVSAKDMDEGGTITYSVKSNCFNINRFSGVLVRSRTCRLSFKNKRKYVFQVEASDGQQISSAEVVVTITDANDHTPMFNESTYFASVYENQLAGTSVLQVNATDGDFGENAKLSYSIRVRDKVFAIDSQTGIISTLKALDRETTRSYKFRVRATDHGRRQKYGRAWVRITVKDLNDNAPKFGHALYNVSLDEDIYTGTLVLQVKATDEDDRDNNKITYSLEKKGMKVYCI